MSIATEIQRLQQAKLDIKQSIEAKGVTVEDELSISDYCHRIDDILVGGVSGLKYASGTVEFADKSNAVIYHNFGIIPRTFYVWTQPDMAGENALLGTLYSTVLSNTIPAKVVFENRAGTQDYAVLPKTSTSGIQNITETSAILKQRSGTYPIIEGITYNWLAIV